MTRCHCSTQNTILRLEPYRLIYYYMHAVQIPVAKKAHASKIPPDVTPWDPTSAADLTVRRSVGLVPIQRAAETKRLLLSWRSSIQRPNVNIILFRNGGVSASFLLSSSNGLSRLHSRFVFLIKRRHV